MKYLLFLALSVSSFSCFAGRQDCLNEAEKQYQACVENQETVNRKHDANGEPRDRSNICHKAYMRAEKDCNDKHTYSGRGAPDGLTIDAPTTEGL